MRSKNLQSNWLIVMAQKIGVSVSRFAISRNRNWKWNGTEVPTAKRLERENWRSPKVIRLVRKIFHFNRFNWKFWLNGKGPSSICQRFTNCFYVVHTHKRQFANSCLTMACRVKAAWDTPAEIISCPDHLTLRKEIFGHETMLISKVMR